MNSRTELLWAGLVVAIVLIWSFTLDILVSNQIKKNILILLMIAGNATIIVLALPHFLRSFRTRWFDHSLTEVNGPPKEGEIKAYIKQDPLKFKARCRCPFKETAIYGLGGSGLIVVQIYFYNVYTDALTNHIKIDLSEFAWLAGSLTLITSLIGLWANSRIKTRTQFRQKWIDELRDALNEAIGAFPMPYQSQSDWDDAIQKYSRFHTRIELYLNPSEELHRALMAMIRAHFGIELGIDKEIFEKLKCKVLKPEYMPFGPKRMTSSTHNTWMRSKTYTLRLANVVLKREWEQVKTIK